MKRIIFVGGANHSGSTMIGCILGSNETSPYEHYHIGEAHAYFNEEHKFYGDYSSAVDQSETYGKIWETIDPAQGYETVYPQLFKHPELDTIIDSSKTPKNLSDQLPTIKAHKDYDFSLLLSYRPFAKIWRSDAGRDIRDKAILKRLGYYDKLIKMAKKNGMPFYIIDTDKFLYNPRKSTKKLCKVLDIPYFKRKEKYWLHTHSYLYGGRTQRKHIRKREGSFNPSEPAPKVEQLESDEALSAMDKWLEENALNYDIV